jgi:Tfp pilus assembly protein PilX
MPSQARTLTMHSPQTSQSPRNRLHPLHPLQRPHSLHSLRHQRGVALFMVLMVTLVIVGLSVSLAVGVFSEQKNARSSADQAIARQGAEAALRDAELDVTCQRWVITDASTKAGEFQPYNTADGNPRQYCDTTLQTGESRGASSAAKDLTGTSGCTAYVSGAALGSDGFSAPLGNAGDPSTRSNSDNINNIASASPSPSDFLPTSCRIQYGAITNQAELYPAGTLATPKTPIYSIEVISRPSLDAKSSLSPIYRLRARGYGRSESTTVDLESLFMPFKDATTKGA